MFVITPLDRILVVSKLVRLYGVFSGETKYMIHCNYAQYSWSEFVLVSDSKCSYTSPASIAHRLWNIQVYEG